MGPTGRVVDSLYHSMMQKFFGSVAVFAFTTVLAAAQTDVALGKTVTSSGYYNQGSEVFPASNITNGETGDTGTGYNWSFWLTPQGDNTGWAIIDLGSDYSLSYFMLQDTHNRGYFDRGTDAYTISVSTNGVNFTQVASDSFSLSAWQNLTWNTDTLGSPVVARYVEVNILSGYGGNSVGLNEVEAFGVPATTPEPAPLAALGLGALGLVVRRKRK